MMKKVMLFFIAVFIFGSLSAAKMYRVDGTSFDMKKVDSVSVVRSGVNVILPVYLWGKMPVIADDKIIWRGKKPISFIEKKYNLELIEVLSVFGLQVFRVKNGDSAEISQKIIENSDGFAYPNIIRETVTHYQPVYPPKDTLYSWQWHLNNTGQYTNYNDQSVATLPRADIRFDDAMKEIFDGAYEINEKTKVAIMDTGVAKGHPDMADGKLDTGYDAINDKDGGNPDITGIAGMQMGDILSISHGTNCSGVAAAEGNELGMSGVCPWCGVYPVKYLEGTTGSVMDDMKTLKSYEKYIADPDIVAVNCSFGPQSGLGTIQPSNGEIEAHKAFMQKGRGGKGGAIVYASGNDGIDQAYNGILTNSFVFDRDGKTVTDKVISVGASSPWDTRVSYSNYGEDLGVTAPSLSDKPSLGIATIAIPGYGDFETDYSNVFSGTSAAAPSVTGFFGTIFSVNPDMTLEEAIDILHQSADKINPATGFYDSNGHSVKYGYGRINLYKAVRLAKGLSMCGSVQDEVCGNNIDDNCDGKVDEGCRSFGKLGQGCTQDSDCVTEGVEGMGIDQVKCLTELKYSKHPQGYCVLNVPSDASCPDGTVNYGLNKVVYCVRECSGDASCERDGYFCDGGILGTCQPLCHSESDCTTGATCNAENHCSKIPSETGGSCQSDTDCVDSLTCLTYWSGGYCTSQCADGDDTICRDGAKCVGLSSGGQNIEMCLKSCKSDSDCGRTDTTSYLCQDRINGKEGVCYRKCRNDGNCRDEIATCNAETGRCEIPGGLHEQQDNDTIESTDTIATADGDPTEIETADHIETIDDTTDTDTTAIKKSSSNGCSITEI